MIAIERRHTTPVVRRKVKPRVTVYVKGSGNVRNVANTLNPDIVPGKIISVAKCIAETALSGTQSQGMSVT